MWGRLLNAGTKAVLGKGSSRFLSMGALKAGSRFSGNPVWALAQNTLIAGGLTYMFAPQETKLRDTAGTIASSYLFMGFGFFGQFFGGALINAAFHAGDYTKKVGASIRSEYSSRTMAAVPFSYSSQGMELANYSFQMAKNTMNNNSGMIGSEASVMAGRYLRR